MRESQSRLGILHFLLSGRSVFSEETLSVTGRSSPTAAWFCCSWRVLQLALMVAVSTFVS